MGQAPEHQTNAEQRDLDDELSGNLLETVDLPGLTADSHAQDRSEQDEPPHGPSDSAGS